MPISLYYGEEDYLLARAVKQLRDKIVQPEWGALSHKVLLRPDTGEAIEAVSAVGFNLGGQTLIEIQDFPWLKESPDNTADEKQLEELLAAMAGLDDTKHVLFASQKVNKKYKFPKRLASGKAFPVEVREFALLSPWKTDEAVGRLLSEAKQDGIALSPQAAELLVEQMGTLLRPLMNEVQKLALYAGNRPITPADVQTLSNHNENTFAMLADWIHNRPRAEVYNTLDELLLREHPVRLFALAQTYVNNAFQLRTWQGWGISQPEMVERTKKHPYKIKMDLQEFSRIPMERLRLLKEKTLDLEWKSKTGQIDARIALEMLMGV